MAPKFTILFVSVAISVVAVTAQPLTVDTSITTDGDHFQQMGPNSLRENCKKLCNDCGCRSYYCGDECICECNTADDSNVNCIRTMRERAQLQRLPFEVLIQGPAGRRFVREATDIDPEAMAEYKQTERTGRSVYSIYKPEKTGKGELMAVAGDDSTVGHPLRIASIGGLTSDRLSALRGRLAVLGAPKSEIVGAAAPADPTVGAPAQDPTVGSPAHAQAADPTVGSPDPTVGAAAEPTVAAADPTVAAADPQVGSSANPLLGNPLFHHLPRIPAVTPLSAITWPKDLFKRLGTGIVGNPLVIQPTHTL